MANKIAPLTETPAWKALGAHFEKIRNTHLRTMFADDPRRAERFSLEQVGLYFDYSKHRVTEETIKLLLELAEQSGLRERIDAMFRGDSINITENRAVLHVALRAPRGAKIILDGHDVVPEVHKVLDAMAAFSDAHPRRQLEGPHRQADPQRYQYRHRRLGPGPGDGVRSAASLRRSEAHDALRVECRRHRFRRGDAATSIRPRRCSSFRRRPSPRSRR